MTAPAIVWFRQDLRLADNPALHAAAATGAPVIPLYILDEGQPWSLGGASRWWLHGSLERLGADLAARGAQLVLRRGDPSRILDDLTAETGAQTIYWNRLYEPHAIARDRDLKASLKARGLAVESFNAALLFEPWTVKTKAGEPFRVFTPFWRACRAAPEPSLPLPAPQPLTGVAARSERLEDWGLLPTRPDWAGGLREAWTPGEAGARERLADFLDDGLAVYKAERDRPDRDSTSRLSPHLHFGEIGPRQVWHAVHHVAAREERPGLAPNIDSFLSEIGWREFSYHLLFHVPTLPEQPLNPRFAAFPWLEAPQALTAWQRGRTGYPLIDAGMRQLWHTGWMHNRVRMIVASFLVKDLLIPWQAGSAWFWDTLVDADLASNAASWQWVAGCGADAAPYFRVFNPVLQGEKFDPDGTYVRRWVPEIAALPDAFIHKPWQAPAPILSATRVKLGTTYPKPFVDHTMARDRALAAYGGIKSTG